MPDGYIEHGVTGWGRDVSADGQPEMKVAGVTVDWDTVPAVSGSDVTLSDGMVIKVGEKYLDAGTILVGITLTAKAVATLNNTPTGGTFTLTMTTTLPLPGGEDTTTALAYNAPAATVQTALRALDNANSELITVTGSAAGPYTVTFPEGLGQVTLTADGALLTGAGAQPTVTVATTEEGADTGKFGPWLNGATDGRGRVLSDIDDKGIVRYPVIYRGPTVAYRRFDTQIGLIQGGYLKKGIVEAALPSGMTLALLRAGFPRIVLVGNMKGAHI